MSQDFVIRFSAPEIFYRVIFHVVMKTCEKITDMMNIIVLPLLQTGE